MTELEWLLAALGFTVTALVVAGMVLLTPHGGVDLDESDTRNGQGEELSRAELRRRTPSRH